MTQVFESVPPEEMERRMGRPLSPEELEFVEALNVCIENGSLTPEIERAMLKLAVNG